MSAYSKFGEVENQHNLSGAGISSVNFKDLNRSNLEKDAFIKEPRSRISGGTTGLPLQSQRKS